MKLRVSPFFGIPSVSTWALAALVGAAVAAGCDGDGGGEPVEDPSGAKAALIDARIRRLTNAEFDRTVAVLLGTQKELGKGFAPDVRQNGFSANAEQRVDSVLADQIASAAEELAAEAVSANLPLIVPCSPEPDEAACAAEVVETFGTRAFRRPISDVEKQELLAVYDVGREGAAFEDGVRLVLAAVLQSASFLYLTELGGEPKDGVVTLTPSEVASTLSYFLTGGPPDDELVEAAASGELSSPEDREREARRLLQQPGARAQVRRFVEEWLGIIDLERTGKSPVVYPEYEALRPSMKAETDAFIDDVVWNGDGDVSTLFGADYTMADGAMASFYGASGGGTSEPAHVSLEGTHRRGILTHASFLATFGRAIESAPIKRGVLVLRRVLCVDLGSPPMTDEPIMPPEPDPTRTTRERFEAHTTNPECRSCHAMIDPIGFSFESFDGMGGYRTTENGKPVDTKGVLEGTPIDGPVEDAADLASKLADDDSVVRCFARNAFRFGSAQSGKTENAFLDFWEKQPPELRASVVETFVAYVKSDLFVTRKVSQ